MKRKVGITTTVPVEVIYAAGRVPVDLNNVFVTSRDPHTLVEEAESAGYPRSICAWIKGIYSTVMKDDEIDTVIAVTQGDCSNTHALMETLQMAGVEIVPFAYPFDRDADLLRHQIEKLMDYFGVGWEQVYGAKRKLDGIRRKVWRLDEMTWKENLTGGRENHLYQVCCSDFEGDPVAFNRKIDEFMAELRGRKGKKKETRLGYVGVPPLLDNLYDVIEELGGRVVFNEVQRQFTMPFETSDLVEQYRFYTYPYSIFFRLEDIRREAEKRSLAGIVHYTQSFCFRQIEDMIIRKLLPLPVLTVEGDSPGNVDSRTRMRIEVFLEMLR